MSFARISVLAVVVAAASVLLLLPSPAPAASCGNAVISDWSDGRIDREYPVSCYRAALSQMPEDLRVYGTARSDIVRALNSAATRTAASATQSDRSSHSSGRAWTLWLAIAAILTVAVPVSLRRFGP